MRPLYEPDDNLKAPQGYGRPRSQSHHPMPLSDEGAMMARLGVDVDPSLHEARIALWIGATVLRFTADEAEQLAVDLRGFALELRNGGKLT